MADTTQPSDGTEKPQDPLDLAADLLFRVLTDLPRALEDFKQMEGSKTLLTIAGTTALIDIAKSLRVANERLLSLEEELRRART